eukprot:TRINITY_DN15696_c0_g1_i1.p1 TRINITY_DN15696_c0_g1~~TRINITY_DN15696_c0_g1_i1.p1  ORF type:complete len:105 (+),score=3.74 TRINITY_DN15696_c0_g1_i1:152-466(+)
MPRGRPPPPANSTTMTSTSCLVVSAFPAFRVRVQFESEGAVGVRRASTVSYCKLLQPRHGNPHTHARQTLTDTLRHQQPGTDNSQPPNNQPDSDISRLVLTTAW